MRTAISAVASAGFSRQPERSRECSVPQKLSPVGRRRAGGATAWLREAELHRLVHGRYGLQRFVVLRQSADPYSESGQDGGGGRAVYVVVLGCARVYAVARGPADRALFDPRGTAE